MEIPIQLFVFSIPSLILVAIYRWRVGETWKRAFSKVGWQGSKPIYFLWSLVVLVVIGGLAWLVMKFIPPELFQSDHVNISNYASTPKTLSGMVGIFLYEAFYVALGEEIFFRGWLGGWLNRRAGFILGNTIQSIIFLLPHLMLLTISIRFWPILIPQFIAGWLQGWLRFRSDSILPGWLCHSLSNTLSALSFIYQ
jgi:membrane protease YdiL (CAAX protease family)